MVIPVTVFSPAAHPQSASEPCGAAMQEPLPDEPKGWRELRAKAEKERDPKKLDSLIRRMNQLLSEAERSKPSEQEKPTGRSRKS
jgi:hypothetical protein